MEKPQQPKTQQKSGEKKNNVSKGELKRIQKQKKKLKKKFELALTQAHRLSNSTKVKDIISTNPTLTVFIIHFGVGSEDDFLTLQSEIDSRGVKYAGLDAFPGYSHCFLTFDDLKNSQNFLGGYTLYEDSKLHVYTKELPFEHRSRSIFMYWSNLPPSGYQMEDTNIIPDASKSLDISGLTLLQDFLSEEEEAKMMEDVDSQKWNSLKKRRVQHYGYEFLYGKNRVNPDNRMDDLPQWLEPGLSRLNTECSQNSGGFDQLTINEYYPGQGIPPHVDSHAPFEEFFAAISLCGDTVMTFKSCKGEIRHVCLPRRSAIIFSGEGRYSWFHSISTRKVDRVEGKLVYRRRRVSLTFRKVKRTPCSCRWPIFCDSRGFNQADFKFSENIGQNGVQEQAKPSSTYKMNDLDRNIISEGIQSTRGDNKLGVLERQYVHEVYDKIAPHFSDSRVRPWPSVADYLSNLESGSVVGDIGCGNGKYFEVNPNLLVIATDISKNLLKIAATKINQGVFQSNGLNLPIKTSIIDHAISIAVVHHFSSPEMRVRAVQEIVRVIRVGGTALITVWAYEQTKKYEDQDVFVTWNLHKGYEDQNKAAQQHTSNVMEGQSEAKDDVLINPESGATIYKRYYHLFKEGELEDLISSLEGVEIVKSYLERENWCVIIKKIEINGLSLSN